MTRPLILGSHNFRIVPRAWNEGAPNEYFFDSGVSEFDLTPFSIPDGSWVLLATNVGQSTLASMTVTGLEEMRQVLPITAVGSRSAAVWAGTKGSSNLLQIASLALQNHAFVLVWGTGSPPSDWLIGEYQRRQDFGASPKYHARGLSVSAPDESLALMVAFEATNAMEVGAPSVDNGFTQVAFAGQVRDAVRIETVFVASKSADLGSTGDTTVLYANPQDSNGGGFQIVIPPAVSGENPYPHEVGAPVYSSASMPAGNNALNLLIPLDARLGEMVVLTYRQQGSPAGEPSSPHAEIYLHAPIANDTYRYVAVLIVEVTTELLTRGYVTISTDVPGSGRWVCAAQRFRNVDRNDPVVAVSATLSDASPANGITKSAWVSEEGHTTLIVTGAEFTPNNSIIPTSVPGGVRLLSEVEHVRGQIGASRTGLLVYSRPSKVAEGPDAFAWTGRVAPWVGALTLRTGETPETPDGIPMLDQEGRTVYVTYSNEQGQSVVPSSVQKILPGFRSNAELLATPGATWAHRGGGDNWAEMSEFAYDNSVLRGYGVLEFSAQRSSDGVWFGMHDRFMDRTTLGTNTETLDSRTHTWAQIQNMMIEYGGIMAGGPQPYFRLEEFLDKYGKNCVLILDPKNAISWDAEMLAIIGQRADPERCIYKYYGSLGADKTLAAQDMGMKTWGYFYQTDYDNGTLATYQDRWDILGMDFAATTAWTGPNNVLSYGKPVTAHIAKTQAQYDLGISKGASMVQCSNTAAIQAVGAPLV